MTKHNDKTDPARARRGFAHAGFVVGIQGELTNGMRRRIMAALRLSSLCIAFGRRSRLGALGRGRLPRLPVRVECLLL